MIRALLVSLALTLTLGGVAWAKPPIWTVTKDRSTVVLFGSVHLLPAGVDWRPQALTDALAKADALWFELPIDEDMSFEAARLAAARGLWPPQDHLSAHLSTSDERELRRVAAQVGVSIQALERMRPWLAELTLSLTLDAQQGATATQGVELQIQNAAPATAKRQAFETAEFQVRLLADEPERDQVASLVQTLTEIDQRPDLYKNEVDEWLAGDLKGLETDALDPLEKASPAAYRRLITDRNVRWTQTIQEMLRRPGVNVVVVGMGHLIGPGGVPALLRARGLTVTGP